MSTLACLRVGVTQECKLAAQVTVLDKSQADWDEHKKNAGDNADLAEHNRSANRCARLGALCGKECWPAAERRPCAGFADDETCNPMYMLLEGRTACSCV